MRATYLEIYQEEVRDLLSKNPNQRLDVKETPDKGVYVKGLVQFVVKSVAEINSVLQVQAATCIQSLLFSASKVIVSMWQPCQPVSVGEAGSHVGCIG